MSSRIFVKGALKEKSYVEVGGMTVPNMRLHETCCAQHPGIGHVIDGSTAYLLPGKLEDQPHTYLCMKSPPVMVFNPTPDIALQQGEEAVCKDHLVSW
jgi:hypothetical protein